MKRFAGSLLATLLFMAHANAFAGVLNSPHDIAAQKYTVAGKEDEHGNVCNYCHVPHKAKGARLWATAPQSLKGWGRVGPLCYSCHDGVAIVSPNVDASNTAFNPRSHGLDKGKFPEGDDMSASGLPYTTGGTDNNNIECSTCHNPHDNTNRPFLRFPLIDLCEKCHQHRENSGYGINNVEGTHPVHKLPLDEVGAPSPIDAQPDFKVDFPQAYPAENGKYTDGVHWTLGGHLSGGHDGTMECITCHAVHGRQRTGPVADKLLAIDPVKEKADLFCEGCHRGKRGDGLGSPPFPNPGGTTAPRTYHPADDDQSNGPGRIVNIKTPAGWVFGKGGEVLCTTCHKPHGALKNSPILNLPVEQSTFCEECHSTPFPHHPTGNLAAGLNINSGDPHASTRQVVISPDFPSGITYGSPTPGSLYCSTCHRAHNASCQPILVTTGADCGCGICIKCHPKFNPTWQTDDNWKSTHFLGDPTASVIDRVTVTGMTLGTQPGYFDLYPPENRDIWPESRLYSNYGGVEGKDVTCCSCHSFAVGNLTAGDADQTPYLGPVLAPTYQPSDLVSGLLARAGSFKEWLESDVFDFTVGGDRGTMRKTTKYLCEGCHGSTPNSHPGGSGEGFTHPLMNADGSKINPLPPAKLTFNKHVNCESCHQPHEADSKGGFYILRQVDTKSAAPAIPDPYRVMSRTDIEFAPLCQKCHIGY